MIWAQTERGRRGAKAPVRETRMTDIRIRVDGEGKYAVVIYNKMGCGQTTVASFDTPEQARAAMNDPEIRRLVAMLNS
jgi:hypothetical protein